MKKLIALLLCLASVVSVFAGCGGGNNLIANDGKEDTIGTVDLSQEIPDDLTLTIGLPLAGNVEDYDTNAYTLWLESVTGYNLEFVTFQSSAADYKAQLSAMMATGDELPDILYWMDIGKSAYEEYGETGYLVDLAPYYNNKELSEPFWTAMGKLEELDPEQHDYMLNQLNYGQGHMYAYGRIEYGVIDNMPYQAFINQEWLDNLGLKMPTNKDELYNVLVQFRDKDANGNGDPTDEKPLIGYSSEVIYWIINMFVYCNPERWFNVDENNQLYLPQMTDKYREALIFINKLIDEGLMYNSAVSFKFSDVKSLLNPPSGEDCTIGVLVGHPTLVFEANKDSVYYFEAMPYWGYAYRLNQKYTPAVFITKDCEYPLAAWNLLMTMTTEEGAYRQRYGEKEVDWVDADEGATSFLKLKADVKVLNEDAYMGKNNSCWHVVMGTVLIYAENESVQLSDDLDKWTQHKMRIMGDCFANYVEAEENNNPDPKYVYPLVVVPEDVQDADSNERSNSQSLINEARSSFCLGTGTYNDPANDAQWAAYLAELESLGYKTWMSNRQKIYENQYPERIPAK